MSAVGGGGPAGPAMGPGQDVLSALRSGQIQGRSARLQASASLLEASFHQEMFKAMRATVPDDGLTSGGQGEAVFSALLDQHMAEVSAMRNGGELGEALRRYFLERGGVQGGEP